MEFRIRTEPAVIEPIELGEKGFSIGSCFAENIAGKLAVSGFDVVSNPFGVLYNPESIDMALQILTSGRRFTPEDLVCNGDNYCSTLFHGSFSGSDPEQVVNKMNRAVAEGQKALKVSDFIMISFGTPWKYTVSDEFVNSGHNVISGQTVANCHKFPAGFYHRHRMEVDQIVNIYNLLHKFEIKGKKVIYTVSPVRYVKDGLHGNNLGKAILHLAVERICAENPNAFYFPAFEILTDELRDYRFYGDDMMHPSQVAIEYIWELFRGLALTPQAASTAIEIEKLSTGMLHRVQSPGSAEHLKYLRSTAAKAASLSKKYPGAHLDRQIAYFNSELGKYNDAE